MKKCIGNQGFSLIEVSIVLVVLGIVLSGMVISFAHTSHQMKARVTQERFEMIYDALSVYVQRHKGLPCPASPDGFGVERDAGACFANDSANELYSATQGVVPWRELGLPESVVIDGWGRYITYKPAPHLTVNYFSAQMQNDGLDDTLEDVHNACRSKLWFDSQGEGVSMTHTHVDRAKALFCCNMEPNNYYLDSWQSGGSLPTGWRGQAVVSVGAIDQGNVSNLNAGSTMPGNVPVKSTNEWIDRPGNLNMPIYGSFKTPDNGNNTDGDSPLLRATGQAVTLVSHGGDGILSFRRDKDTTSRLQGDVNQNGIDARAGFSPDEQLNVWPPQIVAATVSHPKNAAGTYDPFGKSDGASDDMASFMRSDRIWARVGSSTCMRPAVLSPYKTFCEPDSYDDVVYVLDTSNSMRREIFEHDFPGDVKDSRINVARQLLQEVLKAHLEREMADNDDLDFVGYTGFDYLKPQYSDSEAFFEPAFLEEEAQYKAGNQQPLIDALTAHGGGNPDLNGDGAINREDISQARIEVAMQDLDDEIDVDHTCSQQANTDCTTNGTPVIKTTHIMAETLFKQAEDKTCKQLVTLGKTGLPSVCSDIVTEYNTDPAAFQAKYNPEVLEDKNGDGKYDVEPNAVVVISDGDDTVVKHPDSGLATHALRNRHGNETWAQEQIREIYTQAGLDIVAMQDKFNETFEGFDLQERVMHVHIIDVVGNPGLEKLANMTGGQRVMTRDKDELLNTMKFLSGIACPDS